MNKFLFLALFPICLKAQPLCRLQPDHFDHKSKSLQIFEKNIEEKMTQIYQNEYQDLFSALKMKKELNHVLNHYQNLILNQYGASSKEDFLNFFEQNFDTEIAFNSNIHKLQTQAQLNYPAYRDHAKIIFSLKQSLEDMDSILKIMQEPYFLYTPEFEFSIRENNISYGDLKMEVFFRPPKENMFKIPFLNIGFETDQNTVIYTCIHFDSFDPSQNIFYIYFLNMTKLYSPKITDLFFNTPLMMRHLLTLRRPPQALITPMPFVFNPLRGVLGAFEKTERVLQWSDGSLSVLDNSGIMNFIGNLNFLDITSNLNPIQKVIVDNIDIGIKGILVQPEGLKIRYAGSAFYGLVTFNLAQTGHKSDFSYFMNVMTAKPDG